MNSDISKTVIVCDLDGTLAHSKSLLESDMSAVIAEVLKGHRFAVISGGAFPQFEKQFISQLSLDTIRLNNLYLFPANGSTAYAYDDTMHMWKQIYDEPLTVSEKSKIIDAIQYAVAQSGILFEHMYGEQIEDRGGQVTFSALGQEAPVEVKEWWDTDQRKRRIITDFLLQSIPEFEIKIGGATSIDITRKGIDKAYALRKIEEYLGVSKEDILFIGDAIFPGGNDYAVVPIGISYIKVSGPEETIDILKRYTQV